LWSFLPKGGRIVEDEDKEEGDVEANAVMIK
jgi:hypothetical protein